MTVTIDSLRKEYDVGGGIEVAVDGVDLEVGEHEFVTLVGPSGCGKTTTLRCVAGLETPTDGEILLDGDDATYQPAHKRNLAMMFQNIALYPHMTARNNIAYPLKVRDIPKDERYEEAEEAAEVMQIAGFLDKYPGDLSGGQRQRAALARTIVQKPRAFLMDEPLSDLDAKLKVEIRKEIQRVHRRVEKPTIYVTHDQEEAMTMSDRIAVMNDGQFEQIGTPEELYQHPENRFVAQFIGNPTMNFVTGKVKEGGGETAILKIGGEAVEIRPEGPETLAEGTSIELGFRPENVELLEPNAGVIEGTVNLVEQISDRLQVTIETPEGEIRSLVEVENPVDEDQDISISFRHKKVHIFDHETGEIVTRATYHN